MSTLEENARFLMEKILAVPRRGRIFVGIAGAPGSGKSTLAGELCRQLNLRRPSLAAVVPLDGFHFDDAVLRELDILPRKGAIETFDVDGFVHLLWRLRDNREEAVAIPVFDRAIEIARAGGRLIRRDVSIVIVEGNYLLVQRPVWKGIWPLLDVSVMLHADDETLRRRLTERWEGYRLKPEAISRKLEGNDLPNGIVVAEESARADFHVQT